MKQLKKLYEAVNMLESLGIPVSPQQRDKIARLENNHVQKVIIPAIQEAVAPFVAELRGGFELIVAYSKENGVDVKMRRQSASIRRRTGVRKPITKLLVQFPDGTAICCTKATETMAETIERIGRERVMALNVRLCGQPIIGKVPPKGRERNWMLRDGYYYFINATNINKQKSLREISARLGLKLKVSVVEK